MVGCYRHESIASKCNKWVVWSSHPGFNVIPAEHMQEMLNSAGILEHPAVQEFREGKKNYLSKLGSFSVSPRLHTFRRCCCFFGFPHISITKVQVWAFFPLSALVFSTGSWECGPNSKISHSFKLIQNIHNKTYRTFHFAQRSLFLTSAKLASYVMFTQTLWNSIYLTWNSRRGENLHHSQRLSWFFNIKSLILGLFVQ